MAGGEVVAIAAPEPEDGVEGVVWPADKADVGLAQAGTDVFGGGPAGAGVVGLEGSGVSERAAVGADEDVQVALAVDGDAGGVVNVVGGGAVADQGRGAEAVGGAIVGGYEGGHARGVFFGFGGFGPSDVNLAASGIR